MANIVNRETQKIQSETNFDNVSLVNRLLMRVSRLTISLFIEFAGLTARFVS